MGTNVYQSIWETQKQMGTYYEAIKWRLRYTKEIRKFHFKTYIIL